MSQHVNLEMGYGTYLRLCDAVENAAEHADSFDEIQSLVHLMDYLEEEYMRDRIWIIKLGKCMRNYLETKRFIIINIFIRLKIFLRIISKEDYWSGIYQNRINFI